MCLQTSVVFWRSSQWKCPRNEKRWKRAAAVRIALSTTVFLVHLRCTGWKANKLILYAMVLLVETNTNKSLRTLFMVWIHYNIAQFSLNIAAVCRVLIAIPQF